MVFEITYIERDPVNPNNGCFFRWLRFRWMLRACLVMICMVCFGACTHHSVTQPNPSPYEDLLGIYSKPLNHLSAVRRGVCPMYPSCSQYSRQVVEKHGFLLGWAMAMDRLLRCGRDELRRAPKILVQGEWKFYDPPSENDNWWYTAGDDINPDKNRSVQVKP